MAASAGRVVLITGGASGIGAATARALKAKGAIPVLIDCEAGQLRAFLLKAADIFEERTERATQRLATLAEPAMIVKFALFWRPLTIHRNCPLSERIATVAPPAA